MSKKNFKRTIALMLAATMTVGSAMTVFAVDDGIAEGTGTFEGVKEEPIPTITVPTDAQMANAYDYVADPNGMIKDAKDHGRLGATADIDADAAGILFQYETGKYGKTSKKIEVESKNYKDVDVTVELKLKDGAKGDADIVYADSADFGSGDTASKEKKLYLAITDAAATSPKIAALPASGVVKLTQKVEGKPDNYELQYNSGKYGYEIKTDSGWNKVGFALTGAINTNAEWKKDATFPTLVVTWSFAEHVDSYLSTTTMSASSNSVVLNLPANVTVKKAEVTLEDGTGAVQLTNQYTITGTTLTVPASTITAWLGLKQPFTKMVLTFSDDKTETISFR